MRRSGRPDGRTDGRRSSIERSAFCPKTPSRGAPEPHLPADAPLTRSTPTAGAHRPSVTHAAQPPVRHYNVILLFYNDIRAGPICHTPSGRIPTPDVDQSTVADNARAAHGYYNIII